MNLWRISNYETLNGEGGRRAPARWHSGGLPIVYLAESPPGSLIELLAHLELIDQEQPIAYKLLHIKSLDSVRSVDLRVPTESDWKDDSRISRMLGDAWLESGRSALARVPSAILPETYNYLLNPLHADAPKIKIVKAHTALLDTRVASRVRR